MLRVHSLVIVLLLCPKSFTAIQGPLKTCRPWCNKSFTTEEYSEHMETSDSLQHYLRIKYDILSSIEEAEETHLLLPPPFEKMTYPTCPVLGPTPFSSKTDIYSYFLDKHVNKWNFNSPASARMGQADFDEPSHVKGQYELDIYSLLEILIFAITVLSALSVAGLFHVQIILQAVMLQQEPLAIDQESIAVDPQVDLPRSPEVFVTPQEIIGTASTPNIRKEPAISIDIPSPKLLDKGSPVVHVNDENLPLKG